MICLSISLVVLFIVSVTRLKSEVKTFALSLTIDLTASFSGSLAQLSKAIKESTYNLVNTFCIQLIKYFLDLIQLCITFIMKRVVRYCIVNFSFHLSVLNPVYSSYVRPCANNQARLSYRTITYLVDSLATISFSVCVRYIVTSYTSSDFFEAPSPDKPILNKSDKRQASFLRTIYLKLHFYYIGLKFLVLEPAFFILSKLMIALFMNI